MHDTAEDLIAKRSNLTFSESVRQAAEELDLEVMGVHNHFDAHHDFDHPEESEVVEPVVLGAVILQSQLINKTPKASVLPTLNTACIRASEFLSDTETTALFDKLQEQARAAGQDEAADDLERARKGEVIAFGRTAENAEDGASGASPWLVGGVVYDEPSERMIGPEHKDTDPIVFAKTFMERGGLYMTFQPPTPLDQQFTVATRYIHDTFDEFE